MAWEPSSPHMRLAAQAGVVDEALFLAICESEAALSSASFLAEFWDSDDECAAWAAANMPANLCSRFGDIHAWCVSQSAAWAHGAVGTPSWAPFHTMPSETVEPALPRAAKNQCYASVPLKPHVSVAPAPAPPQKLADSAMSKRCFEELEYDKALSITVKLAYQIGACSKLMMDLQSSSLPPDVQLSRLKKVIRTQSPAAGSLRGHSLAFRRLVDWGGNFGHDVEKPFLMNNIEASAFLEHVATLGVTVPQATASSLKWWLATFNVGAGFDLRSSIIRAEIKAPMRDSGHAAQRAKPFELAQMEQVESVCCRALSPVHKGMAGWVANLAHAGLRGEDAQRLVPQSGVLSPDAIGGVCRKPKPHGVINMQWAALRSGVLDEDWGLHAWEHLFGTVHRLGLDFTLPGITDDMNGFIWSRHANKHEQVMVVRFVLTHPEGAKPVRAENVLEFTPHSPRFFYDSVGSSFGFSEDERRNFGNWAKGSAMPARYDA